MTQIRQDFQVMAELLLAAASPSPDSRSDGHDEPGAPGGEPVRAGRGG
jgi:hypothetical protein